MNINKVYRYELDPNRDQLRSLANHAGAARYVYNWGYHHIENTLASIDVLQTLAIRQGASTVESIKWAKDQIGPVPWSMYALRKRWNIEKHVIAPWWGSNNKEVYANSLADLARAYSDYFRSRSGERQGSRLGWPKPKQLRRDKRSFRLDVAARVVDDRHLSIHKIGVLRVKEKLCKLRRVVDRGQAKIGSVSVVGCAGRWYVVFNVSVEVPDRIAYTKRQLKGGSIASDVGVKVYSTQSDGSVVDNPRIYARHSVRLKRYQRISSRRQPAPGHPASKGYRRSQDRLARLNQRVANQRSDFRHKYTSGLVANHSLVVIEDLYVRGLVAKGGAHKRGLNKAVLDVAPGSISLELGYKCVWSGCTLVRVGRFYPSSKRCSQCGLVKTKLGLGERVYCCESCGLVLDRDLNAARNLLVEGLRLRGLESIGTASGAGTDP